MALFRKKSSVKKELSHVIKRLEKVAYQNKKHSGFSKQVDKVKKSLEKLKREWHNIEKMGSLSTIKKRDRK